MTLTTVIIFAIICLAVRRNGQLKSYCFEVAKWTDT